MTRPLAILAVLLAAPTLALADVTVGGITFDDNAFADVVVDASPLGTGHFALETEVTASVGSSTASGATGWFGVRSGRGDLADAAEPGSDRAL